MKPHLNILLSLGNPIRSKSGEAIGLSTFHPNENHQHGDDPAENPSQWEETVAEVLDGGPPGVMEDQAARIRDTWNACHGLDLPADVEPGILADLVMVSGDMVRSIGDDSLTVYHGTKLANLLAKLAPVSPSPQ
jgi:hypothetical protein